MNEEEINENLALQRRIKANQMQRNVRKSRIWLTRLRGFLRVFLIFLLIYFAYRLYYCKMWYVSPEAFNSIRNQSLQIVGNKITPSYKILTELRKTGIPNKQIFLINTTQMEENVSKLPPVKKVYIRRFWFPAHFVVLVDERIPVLTISPSAEVSPIAFFAQGGTLIGRDYMPLRSNFKTYLVLTYGTRGDDYRNWDEKKITTIEKLAKTVEANSHEKIDYLDFRDPKDIYIRLQTTDLRIGELNSTIFKRIEDVGAILKQVKKMNKKVKYVDLRWEETYYIKLDE